MSWPPPCPESCGLQANRARGPGKVAALGSRVPSVRPRVPSWRNHQKINLLMHQLLASLVDVVGNGNQLHRLAQVLLVEICIPRQVRACWDHQHRVQWTVLAAVTQTEQAHDEKWAEDQAEQRAWLANDLEHVLDDERGRPRPALKRPEQ